MTIGWGVIGVGTHVKRFMAPALTRAGDTKFVAICSRSMERARSFAAECGVKRAYDSLAKMLEDPEVEVVYIATPNSLHASHTILAAKAGKHVLCEKPMALTVSDCERMIQVCEQNKVKLGINFQNRYHPAHIEARQYVQSGEIGKIYVAKAQYCHGSLEGRWHGWRNDPDMTGTGALGGTGLHPIDLLRFLLNSEVERVQALLTTKTPYHKVDEMIYVILEFENGVDAVVISGILAPRSDNDAVVYGSRAKITCKGTIGTVLKGELLVEGEAINLKRTFPTDPVALYVGVIEAFNKCIKEQVEPEAGISGYNGLQMARITNAIIQSSCQGKAIKIEK